MDAVVNRIAPDDIDADYAPRRRPELLDIEVGPELVVLDGPPREAHVLNPTARMVWGFFDGQSTLSDLSADLSEATGADAEVIRADLVSLTRELGRAGLLEGVAPDDYQEADPEWTADEQVDIGREFEGFALPDLDGTETALESLRGRRVLLVNWSPTCVFCNKIAGRLAESQDALSEGDVELVFVTSGTAQDNRELFAQAGLRARALLKQEGIDPFPGFGTPTAYLLDEDGRVAAPMAYGADEVSVLALELAGLRGGDSGFQQEARYLPAPPSVCGPGGSRDTSGKATSWAGSRVYRMGEFNVGLRYNTEQAASLLDRLFPSGRVDDPAAPDNYSVALSAPADRKSRELNLLVRGVVQLVRSRSSIRVLSALVSYLSADMTPRDPSLIHVNANGAVRGGEALLLPPGVVNWLKEIQPRLSRMGIQLVDLPFASLDPSSGELVVPEPAIDHDAAVLEEAEEGLRLGGELPPVRPGRYPLTTWYLSGDDDQVGPLSPAFGVASAVRLILHTDDLEREVNRMLSVFERARPIAVRLEGPEALAGQLAAG